MTECIHICTLEGFYATLVVTILFLTIAYLVLKKKDKQEVNNDESG